MRTTDWCRLRRSEVEEAASAGALVAQPLGTIDQHGLHPPMDVDINCAQTLARRAAEAFSERPVLVAYFDQIRSVSVMSKIPPQGRHSHSVGVDLAAGRRIVIDDTSPLMLLDHSWDPRGLARAIAEYIDVEFLDFG